MLLTHIKFITVIFLLCILFSISGKSQSLKTLYLFSGQGSDFRIFSQICFDSGYKIVNIRYPVPAKKTTLKQYAQLLKDQIDTNCHYSFVGVSLGGMICCELMDEMHPKKVIIISSAKCRSELPLRYRFQKNIPVYKLLPKGILKLGAKVLQPIVEPDRKKFKAIFKSMLAKKDKMFLKRSIGMIVNWDKKKHNEQILHIHGTKDHTLPIRKLKPTIVVENGSHMMTLTRAEDIQMLVNEILK